MKNKEKDLLLLEQLVLEGASQVVVNDASFEIFENSFTIHKDNINPSIDEWISMGFSFSIVDSDTYLVYIPNNWKSYIADARMVIILDENGNERAHVSFGSYNDASKMTMNMVKRYSVFVEHDLKSEGSQSTLVERVYFGNPNEKLFYAGKTEYYTNMSDAERRNANEQFDLVCEVARKYADAYYPEWKDVTAYWGKDSSLKQMSRVSHLYDGKKVCFSYINDEDSENIVQGFSNGLLWEPIYEVPILQRDDIDSYIEKRLGVNNGIVFVYELPDNYEYNGDLIEAKYITKAKRLSTGTWFSNPENVVCENPVGKIETKFQLDRWINYNRKNLFKYACLKMKLAIALKKDYGMNNGISFKLKDE